MHRYCCGAAASCGGPRWPRSVFARGRQCLCALSWACCGHVRWSSPAGVLVACVGAWACIMRSRSREPRARGGVVSVGAQVLGCIPVNVCGLALGLVGLGVTWQSAAEILEFPPALKLLTDLISLLTLNLGGSLVLLYLCKVIVAPAALKRDLETPDSAAVLCTLDMALMSMSWVLHRHGVHSAALAIWGVAVTMHSAILAMFSFHVLPRAPSPGFPWQAYKPAWMIPPIGICMASGSGRALGMGPWVEAFFYIGLFFYFFMLPAAIYRVSGRRRQAALRNCRNSQPCVRAAPTAPPVACHMWRGGVCDGWRHTRHVCLGYVTRARETGVLLEGPAAGGIATDDCHHSGALGPLALPVGRHRGQPGAASASTAQALQSACPCARSR